MRIPFVALIVVFTFVAHAQPSPSVVAPRAILVDPSNSDDVLYWKAGANPALQGSIAKLMTAYVTWWAVKQGYVHWTDTVYLTLRDTQQGCSCMKFSAQLSNSCQLQNWQSITKPNEVFTLRDLLQVTLNQSAGESCDAIAEYVARKVYNQDAPQTVDWSETQLNLFVGLMNQQAKALGLKNSLWITVHGGDFCDFKKGCDPFCTPAKCAPVCDYQKPCSGAGTTVEDLAKLWHALTSADFPFLGLIGSRAFQLAQDNPARPFTTVMATSTGTIRVWMEIRTADHRRVHQVPVSRHLAILHRRLAPDIRS